MTCTVCGRPERYEYLELGYVTTPGSDPVMACRRCCLHPDHRALWDAMAVAEMAVIADPEDSDAFGALLAARVTFDLAVRGTAKRSRRARA